MFGERLKIARKKSGYSLRDLSDTLQGLVTAQALGKYERGEMMPSSDVLIALTKALKEPLSFFMSPMRARLDEDGLDFRKKSVTSAKDRERVKAAVLDHVERYLLIEEILKLDSAFWDRPFKDKEAISNKEDAESLAERLREKWQLGKDPIADMTELLEEYGIKVFPLSLPHLVSGLTCLIRHSDQNKLVPAIAVNSDHTLERRRLTLAHELAHRLMDPDQSNGKLENVANRFAGAFLMPAEHMKNEIGKRRHSLGYRELIELKHIYRVSAVALLVRLEQIEVIKKSTMSYAFRTVAKEWRKKEPEPLPDQDVESPKRFERLCYWALSEGLIALPKAAELLRKPMNIIQEEVKGPKANVGHSER